MSQHVSSHSHAQKLDKHSRSLTKLLRHRVHENGLGQALRPDGFLPLDLVLALPQFSGVTVDDVREIVAGNDKQRLALLTEGQRLFIRANQGHTISGIQEEALLGTPLDLAAAKALSGGNGLAVHGTYHKSWTAIRDSGGLSRMTRNHIHLARGLPGDSGVISGMRKSCEVVIWVDVGRAVASGLTFYTSENGVILTPGDASGVLSSQFFHSAIDRASGRHLLPSRGADTGAATTAATATTTTAAAADAAASSSAAPKSYEPNYAAASGAKGAASAASAAAAAATGSSSTSASAHSAPAAASSLAATQMTPQLLKAHWAEVGLLGSGAFPTVEFYGHHERNGGRRSFSNFYEHPPFDFTLPPSCAAAALVAAGRPSTVAVGFTEKAIMLCKASVMGDYATYDRVVSSSTPAEAKKLGRQVAPFDSLKWDAVVCDVARSVCVQKFAAVAGLREVLLDTGERLIAEMTRNDRNWGTGLDVGHADACKPWRWPGTNILGWALMEARAALREDPAGKKPPGAGGGGDDDDRSPGRKRKAGRGGRVQTDYMID